MLIYTNGKPVREGDVVHIHRKPYTVARLSSQNGWVYVKTMDERASLKPSIHAGYSAYCGSS